MLIHGAGAGTGEPTVAPAWAIQGRRATEAGGDGHVSPSLLPQRGDAVPAYEMKFLLDADRAAAVEEMLAPKLGLDSHCDASLENSYEIASLYTDTPRLDVLHRAGRHRYRKFRLRRYGDSALVYLERKTSRQTRVRKLRSVVAASELPRLGGQRWAGAWPGAWYAEQIARREMVPQCTVRYLRRAYFGSREFGPVRLTFDRELRGGLVRGWTFEPSTHEVLLLESLVVCEFKYSGVLPAIMKRAIQELRLAPGGVSKYRRCMHAFGHGPMPEAGAAEDGTGGVSDA